MLLAYNMDQEPSTTSKEAEDQLMARVATLEREAETIERDMRIFKQVEGAKSAVRTDAKTLEDVRCRLQKITE